MGVLVSGDILVLDNAAIYVSGEKDHLEDYLWDKFEILVLTLPTSSPELNPIELIWNVTVQSMQSFTLSTKITDSYTMKELEVYMIEKC